MDFDADRITYSRLNISGKQNVPIDEIAISRNEARKQYREFIRTFMSGNLYPYRDQLLQRFRKREPWLEVNLRDLSEFKLDLASLLKYQPSEHLAIFELAANEALEQLVAKKDDNYIFPAIQIVLNSNQKPTDLRHITANHMSRLLKVPGIIIGASRVKAKAVAVKIQCVRCHAIKTINCIGPYASVPMPNKCDRDAESGVNDGPRADCGLNSYVVLPDECVYIDQQILKLQECPEVVPTGEMPRCMQVVVDRHLVDQAVPGTRVNIMGIVSLFAGGKSRKQTGNASIRTPYLLAAGVEIESEGSGRSVATFTPAEEEEFLALSRRKDIYRDMVESIAPSISGDYTVDIKKALACQLFGGSRKMLPDGTRLRGDINVLLLGDPSTAKSQFLKFVERVAPVGVYTSGKGSSAAGLTASVIKDSKGEFYLEGGALVLADGGIVCIDEFDKMRENDRVAIHEAMEQQTISVAKAGITTILNSRTSVLAAANPIFGRYDDLKSTAENIALMTTILSRFDLIFVVRDIRDEKRDQDIARHVMGVHMQASGSKTTQNSEENSEGISLQIMKKYISYCRSKCAPRLSEAAAETLSSQYVAIREKMRQRAISEKTIQAVPITVRQLEALVRISESLAKMRLSAEVAEQDVREALRLFKVSTMAAATANGGASQGLASLDPATRKGVLGAETFLKQRIAVQSTVNKRAIIDEGIRQGHEYGFLGRAMAMMVLNGELVERNKAFFLYRVK